MVIDDFMRQQLLDRRHKLKHAVQVSNHSDRLNVLLQEVDRALGKIENGSFGICESCLDTIECDRLITDPLTRFCLDHLNQKEKDDLEQDLQLAAQVQRGLLPVGSLNRYGWHLCYHYEPAGLVSGDYCDIIDAGEAGLYFAVGDVSGKGVAASMLMAHLHAMFRTLIAVGLPLENILENASRLFSESTLPNQYATLVCGRVLSDGTMEISNAGHPAPLFVRDGSVTTLEGSDLPIGMFGSGKFSVTQLHMEPGQRMLIYSDGVSEATDAGGSEYGTVRLRELVGKQVSSPAELLDACRKDLANFRCNIPKADDVTLFVLGRAISV